MSYRELVSVIERRNYVVLDTETTGLAAPAEVIEICICNAFGNVIVNERIKPRFPIPQSATDIHHITNEMVQDCMIWPEIRPLVQDAIIGHDVVVYNATYDRMILHSSDDNYGEHFDYKAGSPWVCAMEGFAERYGDRHPVYGSYRWQRLDTAAKFYGIVSTSQHSAMGDVLTTYAVCQNLTRDFAEWEVSRSLTAKPTKE